MFVKRNPFFKEYEIKYVKYWIDQAPEYELKPVFVNGENQKKYRAVVNRLTGKVVAIVSNRFQLIQHKTVFNTFLEALENKYSESEITGFFRWTDNRAYLFTYFKNAEFNSNDTYRLGLVVTNGVDGTLAIWAKFAGIRLVCTNGLVDTQTIKVVKTVHIGIDQNEFMERIVKRFESIIETVEEYPETLSHKIEWMKSIELNRDKATLIVNKLDLPKKAFYVIRKTLLKPSITLYDLYNAITEYISNYSGLRVDNRVAELARIEKELTGNKKIMEIITEKQ